MIARRIQALKDLIDSRGHFDACRLRLDQLIANQKKAIQEEMDELSEAKTQYDALFPQPEEEISILADD
jgi:hypothetical protein